LSKIIPDTKSARKVKLKKSERRLLHKFERVVEFIPAEGGVLIPRDQYGFYGCTRWHCNTWFATIDDLKRHLSSGKCDGRGDDVVNADVIAKYREILARIGGVG